MDHKVEKLLYSKQDAAEALSLSVRSIDYLITTQRLPMRRVGGKVMIPASAVRRFAREDHPERVRGDGRAVSAYSHKGRGSRAVSNRVGSDSEGESTSSPVQNLNRTSSAYASSGRVEASLDLFELPAIARADCTAK